MIDNLIKTMIELNMKSFIAIIFFIIKQNVSEIIIS